jgi:hypothetical protein
MNLFTFQPSNRLKGQLDAALSPAASTPLIYSSLPFIVPIYCINISIFWLLNPKFIIITEMWRF